MKELDQYLKLASEKNFPIALFDDNHNLVYKNEDFSNIIHKEEDRESISQDFLVSPDSFIRRNGFLFYNNKIKNMFVVMALRDASESRFMLKTEFINFKTSIIKNIASSVMDRMHENKMRVCEAVNEFDQCVLQKLEKKQKSLRFSNSIYNVMMLPLLFRH